MNSSNTSKSVQYDVYFLHTTLLIIATLKKKQWSGKTNSNVADVVFHYIRATHFHLCTILAVVSILLICDLIMDCFADPYNFCVSILHSTQRATRFFTMHSSFEILHGSEHKCC